MRINLSCAKLFTEGYDKIFISKRYFNGKEASKQRKCLLFLHKSFKRNINSLNEINYA